MSQTYSESSSQSIDIESVLRPIEQASGLPNRAYVDQDFMAFERDHVLGKSWVCQRSAEERLCKTN